MYRQISRARFEYVLLLCLEKARLGTSTKAKRVIGGAWRQLIDDMYQKNAERLSASQFGPVVTECADAIIHMMKSVKLE